MDTTPQPAPAQAAAKTTLTHDHIAYRGEVEILGATWSLGEGRMVEIRLCGEPFGRIHPFKKHQQRRNGRMGTRFRAAFANSKTGEALATMELMLASWKDTSRTGQSIRLWIDNEVEVHPFSGCAGRQGQNLGDMFAVVMVELDDDDAAINQSKRDRVENSQGSGGPGPQGIESQGAGETAVSPQQRARHGGNQNKPRKPRSLSSTVHLTVTSAIFLRFLQETKSELVPQWTREKAREYVKSYLKVQSLSELDRDQAAVRRWEKVRQAYEKWFRQEPTR